MEKQLIKDRVLGCLVSFQLSGKVHRNFSEEVLACVLFQTVSSKDLEHKSRTYRCSVFRLHHIHAHGSVRLHDTTKDGFDDSGIHVGTFGCGISFVSRRVVHGTYLW